MTERAQRARRLSVELLMNALTFLLITRLCYMLSSTVGGVSEGESNREGEREIVDQKKKVVADNEKHNASAYGGLCKAWQNILQGKIRSLRRSSPGGPANINTHYRLGHTSSRTAIACC